MCKDNISKKISGRLYTDMFFFLRCIPLNLLNFCFLFIFFTFDNVYSIKFNLTHLDNKSWGHF